MFKKFMSLFLAFALLIGQAPVVFAVDGEATEDPVVIEQVILDEVSDTGEDASETPSDDEQGDLTETPDAAAEEPAVTIVSGTVAPDPGLPSNDELFEAYAEQVLYGTAVSAYGTAAGARLSGDEKLLYDALVPIIRQIAAGERYTTNITVGQTVSGGNAVDAEVVFTAEQLTGDNVANVVNALLSDLPYEMYWYDKVAGCYFSIPAYQLTVCFTVAESYRSLEDGADEYSINTEKAGLTADVAANAQKIVAKYADGSDWDKLYSYKDEICALVSYDYDAAGGEFSTHSDSWQLINVFDNDTTTNVVCEGYSKAFMYLCDLSDFSGDVTCYTVSGTMKSETMSGAHMWNIVTVDGCNYFADVTNSDADTIGSNGNLFLVLGDGSAADGYYFSNIYYAYDYETKTMWGTDADSILTLGANSDSGEEDSGDTESYLAYSYTNYDDEAGCFVAESELYTTYSFDYPNYPTVQFFLVNADGTKTPVAWEDLVPEDASFFTISGASDEDSYACYIVPTGVGSTSLSFDDCSMDVSIVLPTVAYYTQPTAELAYFIDMDSSAFEVTKSNRTVYLVLDGQRTFTNVELQGDLASYASCEILSAGNAAAITFNNDLPVTDQWGAWYQVYQQYDSTEPDESGGGGTETLRVINNSVSRLYLNWAQWRDDGYVDESVGGETELSITPGSVWELYIHFDDGETDLTVPASQLTVGDENVVSVTYYEEYPDVAVVEAHGLGETYIAYSSDGTEYQLPVVCELPTYGFYSQPEATEANYLQEFVLSESFNTLYYIARDGYTMKDIVLENGGEESSIVLSDDGTIATITLGSEFYDTYYVKVIYTEVSPNGYEITNASDYAYFDVDDSGDTEEEIATSGTWGDNVTWEFDEETGTLTISGEGEMDGTLERDTPWWNAFDQDIINLVINEGITVIGTGTFSACTNLKNIQIPDSVTTIGGAFSYCSSLTEIVIPSGVTTIGNSAFADCASLSSVTIPASVTSIGEQAFFLCTALTTVNYGGTEEDWANVTINEDNDPLLSATIVYAEEPHLFAAYCWDTELNECFDSLVVEDTRVYSFAFYFGTKESYVKLSFNDLTTTGVAFISEGGYEDENGDWVSIIGTGATELGDGAVRYEVDGITHEFPVAHLLPAYGFYSSADRDEKTYLNYLLAKADEAVEFYFLADASASPAVSMTVSDPYGNDIPVEFDAETGLVKMTAPDIAPESHMMLQFYVKTADGGSTVQVLEYVVEVEEEHVHDITNGTCECGMAGICGDDLTWNMTSDGVVTIRGTGDMYDYVSLTDGNGRLSPFAGSSLVRFVQINDGVTSIGSNAFESCALSGVMFTDSVTKIGDNAFAYSNVYEVFFNGYFHNQLWEDIDFGTGNEALFDAEVNIPKGTECGKNLQWSFDAATGTLTISGTGKMYIIDAGNVPWVDIRDEITSVVFESGVTMIASLGSCANLTFVTIPETVTKIVDFTFYGSPALTDVYYYGTEEQWSGLTSRYNDNLYNATLHYVEEHVHDITNGTCECGMAGTCGENLTWEYVEDTKTLTISGTGAMDNYASHMDVPWSHLIWNFETRKEIEAVVIGDGVTSIGSHALHGCGFDSLTIPESVTVIYHNAIVMNGSGSQIYYQGSLAQWRQILIGIGNLELVGTSTMAPAHTVHYAKTSAEDDSPEPAVEASGTYGDNLTWVLKDGVLTVSGSGEMINSSYGTYAPWAIYQEYITAVVIESGVTTVGDCAFMDMANITSVSLPDGITKLGMAAFTSLSVAEYEIPDTVTEIGSSCFAYSATIERIEIPDSVTTIGDYTFASCSKLSEVHIPANVTTIGEAAFMGCAALTTVNYGGTEENWANITISETGNDPLLNATIVYTEEEVPHLFAVNTITAENVTECTIPRQKTITYEFRFGSDTEYVIVSVEDLTTTGVAVISESQGGYNKDDKWIPFIDVSATGFGEGTIIYTDTDGNTYKIPLTCVLPECWIYSSDVRSEDTYLETLNGTPGETLEFYLLCGEDALNTFNQVLAFDPNGNELAISYSADTGLVRVTAPETSGWIEIAALAEEGMADLWIDYTAEEEHIHDTTNGTCECGMAGTCGDNLTWTFDELSATLTISGEGAMWPWEHVSWPWSDYEIENLVLNDGVTEIGMVAFAGQINLNEVIIPNTVTFIGEAAFSGCSNLTDIVLSNNINSISDCAFQNCTSLRKIAIPDGVAEIRTCAFQRCTMLGEITIPDTVVSVGANAFGDCGALTTVNYGGSISNWANVVINDGNELLLAATIVFSGTCGENLTWELKNGVLTISGTGEMYDYTDQNGDNLSPWYELKDTVTSAVVEEGVTSIGANAFIQLGNLKTIELPTGLTKIGEKAFGWSGLTAIDIPSSVTEIGAGAFASCYELTTVELYEGLTVIDALAFNYCNKLSDISIPSTVETIGYSAFYGCAMESVIIPANAKIGDDVFGGCNNLQAINVDVNNPYYESVDGVLFTEDQTTLIRYPAQKSGAYTIPAGVTTIAENAFGNCVNLTSVIIPDTVTTIPFFAFEYCTGLQEITIPVSVTNIDMSAFNGCTALTTVNYGGTEENWANITISETGNDPLLSATIVYAEEEHIHDTTNGTCECGMAGICGENLTWELKDGMLTISGTGEMYNYVSAADGGDNASPFANSTEITSVIVNEGVTSIGGYAFEGCNMTLVQLPTTLEAVGVNAFKDWNGEFLCIMFLASVKDWLNVDLSSGNDALFTSEMMLKEGGKIGEELYWQIIDGTLTFLARGSGSGMYESATGEPYEMPWAQYADEITKIDMQKGITIHDGAFAGLTNVTEVTLPTSLLYFQDAFGDCTALERFSIPTPNDGGYEVTADGKAILRSNTEVEGTYTLYAVAPTVSGEFTIPAGVTAIHFNAFKNCTNLNTLNVPASVTLVLENAFSGYTALTTVNYGGTEEDWAAIGIQDGNDALANATITCKCDHVIVTDEAVAVTCTTAGLTEGSHCSVCGEVIVAQNPIPATGHYYDAGTVTAEPTCTTDGAAVSKCTVCGDTITARNLDEILVKRLISTAYMIAEAPVYDYGPEYILSRMVWKYDIDYTYRVFTVSAEDFEAEVGRYFKMDTMMIQMLREYAASLNPEYASIYYDAEANAYVIRIGGGFGGWNDERQYVGYVKNGGEYTAYYKTINYVYPSDVLPEGTDTYEYFEELGWPSSFEYGGYTFQNGPDGYYCIAGYEDSGRAVTMEFNDNVVRIVKVWDFTAAELPAEFDDVDGGMTGHIDNDGDYHCDVCKENVCASHVPTAIPAVDATCTATGLTEGTKCENCGKILEQQEVVGALGHTEVIDAAVAPTCTETGLTEGTKCSVCGEILEEQMIVPAKGHDFTNGACICGMAAPGGVYLSWAHSNPGENGYVLEDRASQELTSSVGAYDRIAFFLLYPDGTKEMVPLSELVVGNPDMLTLQSVDYTPDGYTCNIRGYDVGTTTISYGDYAMPVEVLMAYVGFYSSKEISAKNYIDSDYGEVNCRAFDVQEHGDTLYLAFRAPMTVTGITLPEELTDAAIVAVHDNGAYASITFNDKLPVTDDYGESYWMTINYVDQYGDDEVMERSVRIINQNGGTEEPEEPEHTHTEETIPAVDATCTADGLTEGAKCSVCGEITKEQEIVPMLAHNVSYVEAKAATYTAAGYEEHYKCNDCGALFLDALDAADNKPCTKADVIIPQLVEVTEGKAEVKEEVIEEAISNATETTVTLPLTEAAEDTVAAQLPVASLEKIAEAEKELTIETSFATVTMDTKALETIVAEAGDADSIELVVEEMATEELNSKQQTAISEKKVAAVISAEILVNGDNVHDFDGGIVTVKIPFAIPEGGSPDNYYLVYVDEMGNIEEIPSKYENGYLVAELKHFSEYVIMDDSQPEEPTITRIAGAGRSDTAVKAADVLKAKLGVAKFDRIILANGLNFADALAGSYLAAVKSAPILLYSNAASVTLNEDYILSNLSADGVVYLLGGGAAVPQSVEDRLVDLGITVKRLYGSNRFGTNLEILEEAGVQPGSEILVATGLNFADSLSASATGKPILLVNGKGNSLTADQRAYLAQYGGGKITILGGTGAVSASIEAELRSYGEVNRLAGSSRYATSTLIAEEYFGAVDTVVIAYGLNFPDGLSGGPVAYAMNAPLVLTAAKSEEVAAKYVAANPVTNGYIMGGTGALSEETVNKIFGE